MAFGIATGVPFVSETQWAPLWLGAILLVGISFVDDMIGLPVLARLVSHFLIAGGFAILVLPGRSNWWFIPMIIAIVWMINLYNFMDGIDGLAGGMAVFGFGFLSIAAWLSGHSPLALINASIVGGAAAFLLFNFHPARVFLGDTGSTAFGFLAAGIGLIGWRDGVWSLWLPFLVFSPFIIDATVTLLKRILKGEKFWQAHRSHHYQRLVLNGWGHRKTALAEYGLMTACGLCALVFQWGPTPVRVAIILLWVAGFWLLARAVTLVEHDRTGKTVLNAN